MEYLVLELALVLESLDLVVLGLVSEHLDALDLVVGLVFLESVHLEYLVPEDLEFLVFLELVYLVLINGHTLPLFLYH
ncbi:Uncharacterised protein [Streptococcus pneumoniae]|nr:Uncharacterised protein [Streptococcus pneumoniae]CJD82299.1 Uncharacterised protein [Streptococcus pneumoniae]